MKKIKLLQAVLVLSNLIAIASCEQTSDPSSVPSSPVSSESVPSVEVSSSGNQSETADVKMEDKVVDYDGTTHSILVENLPSDAKVIYSGNDESEPGTYEVTAKVSFADGSFTNLSATLTINKLESVVSAEQIQQAVNTGKGVVPTFTLNNTEQVIKVNKIYTPGTHEIVVFAAESAHYKESNKVTISFDVSLGNDLGVVFAPKNAVVDGTTHEITATNIPDGYHVEYENNTAVAQGTYNAVCKVYNSNNELELTLNALLKVDNPKNAEFEEYLKEFFVDYMGDDYMSWNILTENPEGFGFERDPEVKAEWYTYEPYEDGWKEEYYTEMQGYYDMLKEFEGAQLSYEQQISYRRIEELMLENLEYYNPSNIYDPMASLHYIDSFGGYAADFGTYMESYVFRDVQDIEDCLSYIESLPKAFESYVTYAQDKVDAGYPISDYTIDEMIGYLTDVVDQGEDYYLTDILVNKINALDYLDEEAKANYVAKFEQYMKDYFLTAYTKLAEDLPQFKGKCATEGYLAAYGEVGKAEYEYALKSLLGFEDLDMEAYGKYLKETLEMYSEKLNNCVNQVNTLPSQSAGKFNGFLTTGNSVVGIMYPDVMIDYLKTFAMTIVPTLESTPEITVKYMDDASAKVSNAVAYYMKSPLDGNSTEFITLNGIQLSTNYNDTITTMAHEGYPGHLYAWLYAKQLGLSDFAKINSSTAHGEGWAQYVALKLWEYMKSNNNFTNANDKRAVRVYCDYMYYNDLAAYLAYTYIDYGIHYEGWGIGDVKVLLNSIGFNGDAAQDIYRTLIEMPTTYAAYGYGMSFFVDLHNDAKARLGSVYNEVEYNAALLSHGWCPLGELQQVSDQYIEDTLFDCNVAPTEAE